MPNSVFSLRRFFFWNPTLYIKKDLFLTFFCLYSFIRSALYSVAGGVMKMGNTSAHKKGLYIKILKAESKMWQVKSRCRNSFLLPAPVLCKNER
jgi:hypothetical protein